MPFCLTFRASEGLISIDHSLLQIGGVSQLTRKLSSRLDSDLVPLQFFHTSFLREIVGSFGPFIRPDLRTATLTHPMFARVCMEVDVSLPPKVWIGTGKDQGFWHKIQYEGKVSYCNHCQLQGHSIAECRKVYRSDDKQPQSGGFLRKLLIMVQSRRIQEKEALVQRRN